MPELPLTRPGYFFLAGAAGAAEATGAGAGGGGAATGADATGGGAAGAAGGSATAGVEAAGAGSLTAVILVIRATVLAFACSVVRVWKSAITAGMAQMRLTTSLAAWPQPGISALMIGSAVIAATQAS
jgi:hypothetical protein